MEGRTVSKIMIMTNNELSMLLILVKYILDLFLTFSSLSGHWLLNGCLHARKPRSGVQLNQILRVHASTETKPGLFCKWQILNSMLHNKISICYISNQVCDIKSKRNWKNVHLHWMVYKFMVGLVPCCTNIDLQVYRISQIQGVHL